MEVKGITHIEQVLNRALDKKIRVIVYWDGQFAAGTPQALNSMLVCIQDGDSPLFIERGEITAVKLLQGSDQIPGC